MVRFIPTSVVSDTPGWLSYGMPPAPLFLIQPVLRRIINPAATGKSSENLETLGIPAPFSNGFWYGQPGHQWVSGA